MIEKITQLDRDIQRLRAERDALLRISFPLPDPDAVPRLRFRRGGRYEVIESPQRNGQWTLGKHYISIPNFRNFERATKLKQKLRNTQQASEIWRQLLKKEAEFQTLQHRQTATAAFA